MLVPLIQLPVDMLENVINLPMERLLSHAHIVELRVRKICDENIRVPFLLQVHLDRVCGKLEVLCQNLCQFVM